MKLKKSCLNGRFENEVDNFIATLKHELWLDVKMVLVSYVGEDGEVVKHKFLVAEGDSSSVDGW